MPPKAKDYALSRPEAELLFRQVWLHTFGICVLVAGKICQISPEQISEMLSVEFQGMLMLMICIENLSEKQGAGR